MSYTPTIFAYCSHDILARCANCVDRRFSSFGSFRCRAFLNTLFFRRFEHSLQGCAVSSVDRVFKHVVERIRPCSLKFSQRNSVASACSTLCQERPILLTYSSAPAELELTTVKPVASYLGIYGVFGVHRVHGELTRPPFVAHPSTQNIKTTRGLRHGTKHRRLRARTMIKGCLVEFLGDSHRDVTGLGILYKLLLEHFVFP